MSSGSPQFTSTQLLDAGRRAEAEGRLDLAHQFYGHLSHHYGHTPEGTEGRQGLARIGIAGPSPQLWQMNGEPDARFKAAAGRSYRGKSVPPHRTEYRLGRSLAALLSGTGWLAMAGALLTLVAGFAQDFGQALPPQVPRLGHQVLIPAAVTFLGGLLALLTGQVLRALFDQASAARDLVALERARAGAPDSA